MFQHAFKLFCRKALAVALLCFASQALQAASLETYTNFFDMKFVSVPGGKFKMGALEATGVPHDETPQHDVVIAPYQMMSTEVTLAQYKRFIHATSDIDIVTEAFMDANANEDSVPVTFVSWNDARIFIHWLNRNKPASDTGTYRLPTEAEWEYACHAGEYDAYCGSNTASSVAWYLSQTVAHPLPVAQKQANAFGLYDMSGNVREWVQDCYHDSYMSAPADGHAWTKDCLSNNRIVRGGSWKEGKQEARATDRVAVAIATRSDTIGFRVVREIR